MSDIENASDDDDRSVESGNSDFVDTKIKEYNKNKGIPNFEEASSGSENGDSDIEGENDDGEDDDDDGSISSDSDIEEMENENNLPKSTAKKPKTKRAEPRHEPTDEEYQDMYGDDEDDDGDDDEDDINGVEYLRKFDESTRANIITQHHHELQQQNTEEIEALCMVVRNKQGAIIDPLHRTLPFLTKYERARVLGERAKQINAGAKPLVELPKDLIDGYLIALREFEQKRIPFIIKRPLANGGCEYWRLEDLEVL